MNTAAIIQARYNSTRVPGKVLLEFEGLSVIAHIVQRLRATRRIDKIGASVPDGVVQNPLVAHLEQFADVTLSRGELDDIAGRMRRAADATEADLLVRVFGDCPMIDPKVIDALIEEMISSGADWGHVGDDSGWPLGNECQAFTRNTLGRVDREATTFLERENITPFLIANAGRFRACKVYRPAPPSRIELMLDTTDDQRKLTAIFARLMPLDATFGTEAIEALYRSAPELFGVTA